MKYLKDILSEETPTGRGKYSAKRFGGIFTVLLAGAGSILAGLHFYEIDPRIIDSLLTYSAVALGISIVKNLFNKSDAS